MSLDGIIFRFLQAGIFMVSKRRNTKVRNSYLCEPTGYFQHKVAVDDWRGGVMRTPPSNWTTFKARNEVGSYRREFTIPEDWDGKEIFINFDGVDSFFYLWINGQYVGFSKNSRNTASFNITKYLVKGTNVVAVEVYRSSDGSFLEAQDMFRLPGIYRTVALQAVPQLHVRDLVVTPDLDATYTDGELKINADIRNLGKKAAKGYSMVYSLYANQLYSDDNTEVNNAGISTPVAVVEAGQEVTAETTLKVQKPNKWSAEKPYLYTLVGELKDKKDVPSKLFLLISVSVKWKSKILPHRKMNSDWPDVTIM